MVQAKPEWAGSGPAFLAALVGIASGVVALMRVLLRHALSTDAVLDLLGFAAVLTGVLRLAGPFHDDPVVDDRPRLRSRVVLGTLGTALGAVLILEHVILEHVILPPCPTRLRAITVGAWGLVAGPILLQEALALRRRMRRSG